MKRERKIFSGRSNPELAKKIAISADCQLGDISIKTFSDGEIWVKYNKDWFSMPPLNKQFITHD